MDIQKSFQLGEKKFVEAVNVDYFQQITLGNEKKPIVEYDIRNVLDVSDTFNNERQLTESYRIYGRFDYISLLNGLKNDYSELEDFFNPVKLDGKTIYNYNWYLLQPSGYTSVGGNRYVRNFKVIAEYENFDIYKSGFFVNIYNEQQYLFNIKNDINVGGQLDSLHFPITDVYLYPLYLRTSNGNGDTESLRRFDFPSGNKVAVSNTGYNIGDIVYGDLIEYDSESYTYNVVSAQTYFITCPYDFNANQLVFKYNPFTKISLNVFSSEVEKVNISGTSYEEISSIPYYAIPSVNNDGNYIWRDILPKGYFDAIDGQGVNFPFINQRHYVFNNYLLSVIPDLTHPNTAQVFDDIKYANNEKLYSKNDTLDNLGKIC